MTVTHLPELIRDLAIILGAAAGVSIICQKLRQPVVLGYMVVGFFLGPNSPLFSKITSQPSIQVWADIGVIFLMFSLGLEFRFKDIRKTGGVSTVIALIELPLMMLAGYLVGISLGWSPLNSLFLGGIISVSSTSIILRSVESLNLKNRHFVQLVFGVLVFEDLLAILLLVILSTVAVTREFSGIDLLWASGRLAIFLVVWFLVGILILPSFVRRAKALWSDENILIFSIGLCLLMVLLAVHSGFSAALGAFLMGSILAETDQRAHIERILSPLKNLFSAIFFVSIGMLFQLTAITEQPGVLALLLFVTIFGKLLFPTIGALISGQSIKTSLQTAMSLAQIGEFSFVIAALGIKLKVIDSSLLGLAVSVSVITTFLTPFFMKHSSWVSDRLESLLSLKIKSRLEEYRNRLQSKQDGLFFGSVINSHLPIILINSIFIAAILIFCKTILSPHIPSPELRLAFCLLFSGPFFWGLVFARSGKFFPDPFLAKALRLLRSCWALVMFLLVVFQFLAQTSLLLGLGISGIMVLVFAKVGDKIYLWLESRVKDELMSQTSEDESPLLPWDSHLTLVQVSPHSLVCGSTIEKIGFKETFGALVTAIVRGGKRMMAPDAQTVIYPYDQLYLVGSDDTLNRLSHLLDVPGDSGMNEDETEIRLFSLLIDKRMELIGKTLKDSGMRERFGLVVGVERKGKRILNPELDFVFSLNDKVWLVGDPSQVKVF